MADSTVITSADNPHYKSLKKLSGSARERRKVGRTIIDGIHLFECLARYNVEPELVVLRAGSEGKAEVIRCRSFFPSVRTLVLSETLFDALSPVETPVGLLAVIAVPVSEMAVSTAAVLLENIQDPGNLGALLRTAAAAGIDAAYLSSGCTEAWSPKALRAGMGAQFALALFENENLATVAQNYQSVVATQLDADTSLYNVDLRGSVAFLFGNEGAGVTHELAMTANHRIKIPMPGGVESLNVAAAAAVCLFERVRQLTL